MKKPSSSLQLALITLLLLAGFSTWVYDLDAPWIAYYDSDGAFFQMMIDNYERYGIVEMRAVQLKNYGETPREDWWIYGHFPPLYPILLYGSAKLWGMSEFSLRTINIFFTLLTAAMSYHLMRSLFNWRVGLWASLFFSFSPMIIFWARIPEYEQLASFLILLALSAYLKSTRQPDLWRWKILAWVAVAVAAWVGWAVYMVVTFLFLHACLFAKRKDQALSFSMGVLVGLMGLSFLLYLHLTSDGVRELYEQFTYRSSFTDGHVGSENRFDLKDFATRSLQVILSGFTPTVFLGSLGSGILLAKQAGYWQKRPLGERLLPFVVLLAGASYAILVRQGTYHHEYLWYYLGLGLTLCAAPAVGLFWDRWSKQTARALLLLFIVLFFVASWRVMSQYRHYDIVPQRYELGREVSTYIEADELIATDLADLLHGFNFYAQTNKVYYSITPETFRDSPEFKNYLHCLKDSERPTPQENETLYTLSYDCVLIKR